MKGNYSDYNYKKSIERIDEILVSSDNNYEEKDIIPPREKLTFTNGYYVSVSCLFIDIRRSKKLSEKHKKPTLAKIYRTYISELVVVLNGDKNISEVSIEGDCVWGVFNTDLKSKIDSVFSTAARASSLIDILNYKYSKKGYSEIEVGIGLSYGSALFIKAGYRGSGINEVVWLGKIVGETAELCSFGNSTYQDSEMMVSSVFYQNLNDHNKTLLQWNSNRSCYHGHVINVEMNEWLNNEKGK